MISKTFTCIKVEELEEIIFEKLGLSVEIAEEEMWTVGCYNVSYPTKTFSSVNRDWTKRWVAGGNWPYIYNVMAYLIELNIIPDGDYLIEVD